MNFKRSIFIIQFVFLLHGVSLWSADDSFDAFEAESQQADQINSDQVVPEISGEMTTDSSLQLDTSNNANTENNKTIYVVQKDEPADEDVIVESQVDYTLPYKQRREMFGAIFSINNEHFNPKDYYSVILNEYYDVLTDNQPINLFGFEFGIKYNFKLGSLGILYGYSKGMISNASKALDQISIDMQKIDLNYAMDNVFTEPWIVPYGQIGIQITNWTESSLVAGVVQEESFTTSPNYHLKAGLLFQLNWIENKIDPTTTSEGLRSSGLENTYLDVFYSYYPTPSLVSEADGEEGEANLATSEMGIGLKLEF